MEASEEGSHVAIWWKSDVSRGTNMYRGPEADTQLMHVRKIKEVSMARIGEVRGIIREESGVSSIMVLNLITYLLDAECISFY